MKQKLCKPFNLKFKDHTFKRGDILLCNEGRLRITKVYKYNLYRKILNIFGIEFKLSDHVKVKEIR